MDRNNETIQLAKKAADAWRHTDTYHQAAQIIDMLISALEGDPNLPQPSNEAPPCYIEEKRNTAYPLCAGRGFANCAHCALWSDFEEDQDETRINRPLTLEELRGMNGEPVWVSYPNRIGEDRWYIIEKSSGAGLHIESHPHFYLGWDTYGKFWLAYRHPPEGEA